MNFCFVLPRSRIRLSSPFSFWVLLSLSFLGLGFFVVVVWLGIFSLRPAPGAVLHIGSVGHPFPQHYFWFSGIFLLIHLSSPSPLYLMAVSLSSTKIYCLPFPDWLLCTWLGSTVTFILPLALVTCMYLALPRTWRLLHTKILTLLQNCSCLSRPEPSIQTKKAYIVYWTLMNISCLKLSEGRHGWSTGEYF